MTFHGNVKPLKTLKPVGPVRRYEHERPDERKVHAIIAFFMAAVACYEASMSEVSV